MYLLNYIYFLIITLLGLKFLTMKRGVMVNPLNREQKMVMDGPEMFWVLTFSTGLLALSAPGYGFRVILKYLYPLLIMLFASAAVRDKEVFLKAGLGARLVAVISIPVLIIPMLNWILFPGVFWYGTASAIHYITMCVFSLALFYYTDERKKNLLLCVLFMLPCLVWVFRTSIMGTTLALMTFFFFKYKMKSLPVIFVVLVLFVVAVFAIPSVREKMFKDSENVSIEQLQRGEISKDDINSNARFAMWEDLQSRFYDGKELMGSGIGSVQNYMYSNFVFGGLKVPHNDYVQMSCDSGIIGVVLYLLAVFAIIVHSFFVYQKYTDVSIKMCAIVAGSSIVGVALTMYTDNVVNYSMATLSYPFGFYGMMLGLIKKER